MMTEERVHQRRGLPRRIQALGLPIILMLSGCVSTTPWTKKSETVALPPGMPPAPRRPIAANPPIPNSPPKPTSPIADDPRTAAVRPAPIVPPIERPVPPPIPDSSPAIPPPTVSRPAAPAPREEMVAVLHEPTPRKPAAPKDPASSPASAERLERAATPDPLGLVQTAENRLAAVQSYRVHMTRQERVGSKLGAQEEILLSVRTKPQALRMEWPAGTQAGREVLFQPEGGDGKIHIRMGKNSLVPPLSLDPDNAMIAKSSRHGIADAGMEGILRGLRRDLTVGKATAGTIRTESRTPIGPGRTPCDVIIRDSPEGEHWIVAFDPQTSLPLLVEGKDAQGQLLERYTFQGLQFDLTDLTGPEAFDPDKRWPRPGASLLGAFGGSGE